MRSRDVVESIVGKSQKAGELRYRARDNNSIYREYEGGKKEFIDLGKIAELRIPVRDTHLYPSEMNIGKIYIKVGGEDGGDK